MDLIQESLEKEWRIFTFVKSALTIALNISSFLQDSNNRGEKSQNCSVPHNFLGIPHFGIRIYLVVTGQMTTFRRLVEADGHLLCLTRPKPHTRAAGCGRGTVKR